MKAVPTTKYCRVSSANKVLSTAVKSSLAPSGNVERVSNVWSSSRRRLHAITSSASDMAPPPAEGLRQPTRNVRVESWCAMRRGCSPSGTVRMCSF